MIGDNKKTPVTEPTGDEHKEKNCFNLIISGFGGKVNG